MSIKKLSLKACALKSGVYYLTVEVTWVFKKKEKKRNISAKRILEAVNQPSLFSLFMTSLFNISSDAFQQL